VRLGAIFYIFYDIYILAITYIMRNSPMAGKIGRPKREEPVTPVLLRIPQRLLKRVGRCKAMLELEEGTSISRTEAFWHVLKAGCEALEDRLGFFDEEDGETPVPAHKSISKLSEISGDDVNVPGYGFPEDEEIPIPQRNGAAQVADMKLRSVPAPAAVKTAATTRTQKKWHQRILTLLQAHLDGLDAANIEADLHTRKGLGGILKDMVQDHLLERQGRGQAARYRIATAHTVTHTTPC
jgi:hypothetical protein